jgi:5-(carboxyamino)imidazole ribonucleotide synthase
MVNLIGEEIVRATTGEGFPVLLRTAGTKLHLYGKREVRPRRKMGHVTFLGEKAKDVWAAANEFQVRLGALD